MSINSRDSNESNFYKPKRFSIGGSRILDGADSDGEEAVLLTQVTLEYNYIIGRKTALLFKKNSIDY